MAEVGPQLHPTKTRIVYCKDANKDRHLCAHLVPVLGGPVQARAAQSRTGAKLASFLPAISKQAFKKKLLPATRP